MAEETEEKEDQDQDQDGGAIEKTLKRGGGRRRGAVGEKRTLQKWIMAGLAVFGSLRLSDQSRWVLLVLV